MDGISWPAVIVALIVATSVGQRIVAWCVKNARYIRAFADVLERMAAGGGAGAGVAAKVVKGQLAAATKSAGGGIYEVAQAVAAAAEARAGLEGRATAAARDSRWRRFGRWLVRWIPIVGAFL